MDKSLTKEYQNARRVLENYLTLKFPSVSFKENNKKFLIEYSVLKTTGAPNTILKQLGESCPKFDTYSKEIYPDVGIAIKTIQEIHKRYNSICKRYDNPFGGFVNFLEWWCECMDANGEHHCFYCGVSETDSMNAFDSGKLSSKKFTGKLQIDRKDPNGGYCKYNCVFACTLCNNAKSDMISADDFKRYFGSSVSTYWKHIVTEKK